MFVNPYIVYFELSWTLFAGSLRWMWSSTQSRRSPTLKIYDLANARLNSRKVSHRFPWEVDLLLPFKTLVSWIQSSKSSSENQSPSMRPLAHLPRHFSPSTSKSSPRAHLPYTFTTSIATQDNKLFFTMADVEAPLEPQSRHVVYCGGRSSPPCPTITRTTANALMQSAVYHQRYMPSHLRGGWFRKGKGEG